MQQQTATADVLKVISRSTFDLQPCSTRWSKSAAQLCEADLAIIFRRDGRAYRVAATLRVRRRIHATGVERPSFPSAGAARLGATATEGRTVHIPDVLADPEYIVDAMRSELARISHYARRADCCARNELIGVIVLYRQKCEPFTDKQIELVTTFADQAVIAIENARLLDELRQRTDELGRSVGELRALGEVSQAVNSTLDLETVLSTIVAKAVQLSGTEAGAIYVFDDVQREFHLRATYGMDQELIDALTQQHIGLDEPNVAQALAQREPIQVADLREEAPSAANEITLRAGFRARVGGAAAARRR